MSALRVLARRHPAWLGVIALVALACAPEVATPPPVPAPAAAAVTPVTEGTLSGQVTVETRGGAPVPLGGVEVLVVPDEAMQRHLAARVEAASAGLEALARDRARARAEYQDLLAEADRADQDWKRVTASELRRRVELQFRQPGGPDGVRDLRKALLAEKQAAWSRTTTTASRAHQAERALATLERRAARFLDGAFFLQGLPPAAGSARTEANGAFAVRLEPGRYAVVASGERRQGVATEGYLWLLWTSVEAKATPRLALTSANLHGTDCAECAVAVRGLTDRRARPWDQASRRTP